MSPLANIDALDAKITIQTDYREKELIRQVPGAKWDGDVRLWKTPLSWTSCKMLRAVFGDTLEVAEPLADWAWREFNDHVEPSLQTRAVAMDPAAWSAEPWSFQPPAIEYLHTARAAILGDEMGTGKTHQTVAALEVIGDNAYPVLIACPASVKRQWSREFAKSAPGRTVSVISGNVTKRRKALAEGADVVVMNYELLRHHSRLASYGSIRLTDKEREPKELNAIEFRCVIADEAHRIKDARSKQSRALKAAAGSAEIRYALTGTPIANRPDELWSILNFIAPNEWPSKTRFVDRYCAQSWNGFGNEVTGIEPRTKAEFYDVLDPYLLRRPVDVVLPYLPEITREIRELEMSPAQKRAYDAMEKDYIAAVDGGNVMATTPLTQATRLCQFASASAEVVGENEIRLSLPSNKITALLELIGDLDEQIVVFAQSRQLIDLAGEALEAEKIPFGRITGAESETQRDNALTAFGEGRLRVMLLTLGAGGTGIDGLQCARVAVFLERSWSMVQNRQAEGRLRRGGQEADSILVIDLVSAGTVEEDRLARLELKDAILEEIVRDHQILAAFIKSKGVPLPEVLTTFPPGTRENRDRLLEGAA